MKKPDRTRKTINFIFILWILIFIVQMQLLCLSKINNPGSRNLSTLSASGKDNKSDVNHPQRTDRHDGIDVSAHQGIIDWQEVAKKSPGLRFVYIKATEGATHVDKRYIDNVAQARENGFKIGSYHYFRMTSSAHTQFTNIRKTIDKDTQDLIPMIM